MLTFPDQVFVITTAIAERVLSANRRSCVVDRADSLRRVKEDACAFVVFVLAMAQNGDRFTVIAFFLFGELLAGRLFGHSVMLCQSANIRWRDFDQRVCATFSRAIQAIESWLCRP